MGRLSNYRTDVTKMFETIFCNIMKQTHMRVLDVQASYEFND